MRRDVDLDDVLDAERMRLRRTTPLRVTAVPTPIKVTGDIAQVDRLMRNLSDSARPDSRQDRCAWLCAATAGERCRGRRRRPG